MLSAAVSVRAQQIIFPSSKTHSIPTASAARASALAALAFSETFLGEAFSNLSEARLTLLRLCVASRRAYPRRRGGSRPSAWEGGLGQGGWVKAARDTSHTRRNCESRGKKKERADLRGTTNFGGGPWHPWRAGSARVSWSWVMGRGPWCHLRW